MDLLFFNLPQNSTTVATETPNSRKRSPTRPVSSPLSPLTSSTLWPSYAPSYWKSASTHHLLCRCCS
ncbi:hypothetical protein Patl1_18172 [Pistacia atlantica]|uniref:Uncharacterized protein n=1 Tax=Pistacia atlantica TaxID=434234 RepID=A0ACC1C2I9_9ROSI|nr:hypothetical protein Patl1_18172 [Pistacia atlantica]